MNFDLDGDVTSKYINTLLLHTGYEYRVKRSNKDVTFWVCTKGKHDHVKATSKQEANFKGSKSRKYNSEF